MLRKPRMGVLRIIPAGAGNSSLARIQACGSSDHPRRRGELKVRFREESPNTGSSPQARGTLYIPERDLFIERIIPAGAGNSTEISSTTPVDADHPRRRGELDVPDRAGRALAGSSPQARGTRRLGFLDSREARIIPAGAGNSILTAIFAAVSADHPRRRGELVVGPVGELWCLGSSPQARGTRHRRY